MAPFRNVILTDDLHLGLAGVVVHLSPREGLQLAEELTRKSFRTILTDEASRQPAPAARRRPAKKAIAG